jgi:hypothetical protein
MKLFFGNELLLKIFIELLPEKFIERKYVSATGLTPGSRP